MAKSRPDFVQKPYYKKSHKAMYVDIDGKPRRLCKGDTLTEEGKAAYKAALLEKGNEPEPETEAADDPIVVELVDDFLAWQERQVKLEKAAPRTLEWYKEHLPKFRRFIGDALTLSKFKRSHVKRWLEKDYADAGSSYQNGAVRAVCRVFNWAKSEDGDERISINPIAKCKRPASKSRVCYLTDEHWKIVDAKLSGAFGDYVRFLRLTGCRPHEARIAKVSYFNGNRIVIPADEAKGKKHERVIWLDGEALEIVKRRLGGTFIFTNERGRPWTNHSVNCAFARLRKAIRKNEGPTFTLIPYIFRHTWITNAVKNKTHSLIIAKFVGHTDASMIEKVYGHPEQDDAYMVEQLRKATA